MKNNTTILALLVFGVFFTNGKCKGPYIMENKNVKGFVIAKENCNTNENLDYWLIDLTYLPNTPQFGDTLTLNGITYQNVVKTNELSSQLKGIGVKVSIDYKSFSPIKINTAGCNIPISQTYSLKEIYILNQFEIR